MIFQLDGHRCQFIHSFSEISDRYDVFLLDVWGVLHDSVKPYPGVINCLVKLQEHEKKVILISNVARRAQVLSQELARMGIKRDMYNHVITSGELAWQSFNSGQDEALNQLGNTFYLLGSEQYRLTEGLDLKQTDKLSDADFVFTIGVIGKPSLRIDKEDILQEAAEYNLPMICANPDIRVVEDGVHKIASGSLAARYEEIGGQVRYFGKPHREIYQKCFELLPSVQHDKIVVAGDALVTDVKGAASNGLDSVLMGSGIHGDDLKTLPGNSDGLLHICRREKQYPDYIAPGLFWEPYKSAVTL